MLEIRRVSKQFPGVLALDRVDFSIFPGEVVALIGENGAGKSTLMKILGGVHQPNGGEVFWRGKPVHIESVAASQALGIGFVHQELNVLDNLDVAGNVFLGREPRNCVGLINRSQLRARTEPCLERLGLDLHAFTPLSELSIGQKQMVEIAEALSLDARVIIMDEPTSSLTLVETERLLEVVAELKQQGIAIIYISHRLGEIEMCADRVVALRDGKNSGNLDRAEIHHDAMVSLMVGRELDSAHHRPRVEQQSGFFRVEGLRTSAWPKAEVSFEVAGGEILGVAGLVGAGRSEMAQALFGVDKALAGRMWIDDQDVQLNDTKSAIAHGLYLAPEDRKASGLVLEFPVVQNITLSSLSNYTSVGLIQHRREREVARKQIDSLSIKTPSEQQQAVNLSGGNQQKVVLGKWLSMNPRVLIFDEPTRGIDVGAKREIYTLMYALAQRGVAIIVISSDMEEVLMVSDRIAVMCQGCITGVVERADFDEETIMNLAVQTVEQSLAS